MLRSARNLLTCSCSLMLGALGCASLDEPASAARAACRAQLDESLDGLPNDLGCTGLYTNIERKQLARGVESFEPAQTFWANGAETTRWIALPAGEQIDTSDLRNWRFPVATKLWQEFQVAGARVETRLYQKLAEDRWRRSTYAWNDAESGATRTDGGGRLMRSDVRYVVPKISVCDDCHEDSRDSVLGFDAASLGLGDPKRAGWTLQKLVDRELLSDSPERAHYMIGDDGTGKAADAFTWLHISCGVSCHNERVSSDDEITQLRLDLDPAQLDGRPSNDFAARASLLNQPAASARWAGQQRIVPGDPEASLLYRMITTPGGADAMPPFASRTIDEEGASKIRDWILALAP